jgi:hypothetical protein
MNSRPTSEVDIRGVHSHSVEPMHNVIQLYGQDEINNYVLSNNMLKEFLSVDLKHCSKENIYFIKTNSMEEIVNNILAQFPRLFDFPFTYYVSYSNRVNNIELFLKFENYAIIEIDLHSPTFINKQCVMLNVTIYACSFTGVKNIEKSVNSFIDLYEKIDNSIKIEYYYKSDNDRTNVNSFYDYIEEIFYKESYPYLTNLDAYINAYLNSKESILFLHGMPGSGKTKFIRYIMKNILTSNNEKKMKTRVFYSTDEEVLTNSSLFVDYMDSESNALLVLEDMDRSFLSRLNENNVMHKFLSSSDGIIQSAINKKMIFSSNLININDVDSALLRPGRCFDVIKFEELNEEQSINLLYKLVPDGKEEVFKKYLDKIVKEKDQLNYRLSNIYKIANVINNPELDVDIYQGSRFRTGFSG